MSLSTRGGRRARRFNRYEGRFSEGERDGPGCLLLANGDALIGQFSRGVKAGTFVRVGAQGQVEFRLYERNTVTRAYASAGYYCARPEALRTAAVEAAAPADFDETVAAFRELERGGVQAGNGAGGLKLTENGKVGGLGGGDQKGQKSGGLGRVLAGLVFRTCRQLTAPLRIGLTADLRVCEPRVSEGIAELAREAAGAEVLDEALALSVEAAKAGVVNNYEVLHFLFELGRARDAYLASQSESRRWADPLGDAISEFEAHCASADAEL